MHSLLHDTETQAALREENRRLRALVSFGRQVTAERDQRAQLRLLCLAAQRTTGATFVQSGGHNGLNMQTRAAGFGNPMTIPAHGSITPTFTATYDGVLNTTPPNFRLNGRRCDSNH